MFFKSKKSAAVLTESFLAQIKGLAPEFTSDHINTLRDALKQYTGKKVLDHRDDKKVFGLAYQLTQGPNVMTLQGDVFSSIPFSYIDKAGSLCTVQDSGMLISASCDFENDDLVLLARCIRYSEAQGIVKNPQELTNNGIYRFFYLGNNSDMNECLVVDFGFINAFSRDRINQNLQSGGIQKTYSLTKVGYYFLLLKLYIHFCRIEAIEGIHIRR